MREFRYPGSLDEMFVSSSSWRKSSLRTPLTKISINVDLVSTSPVPIVTNCPFSVANLRNTIIGVHRTPRPPKSSTTSVASKRPVAHPVLQSVCNSLVLGRHCWDARISRHSVARFVLVFDTLPCLLLVRYCRQYHVRADPSRDLSHGVQLVSHTTAVATIVRAAPCDD